ncbi:EAL domain-containing protein [Methylomonas sp. OY6]|uniref:EAL domain-containing protein n=1 Tax=Methylomonas defluvii TaxID=3045149 RepID=A0ABU4UAQ4_9GAMM|nr:EAL domain-containing protein [Methylomonas sp. OY6]MDX8125864.1 EAL domain-containing protein [Methylomonas sp. OY6]
MDSMTTCKQTRILIVDDDSGAIRVLTQILKDVGKVYFTTDSTQALELALSVTPDFILLDIEMPELNGIDLCQRIKNQYALSDVPILFVTCHTDVDTETRALTAGAIDFIHKSANPVLIKTRVQNYLALKHHYDEQRKLAQAVEQSSDSIIITDIDGNIEYVNPMSEKSSGYSRQEMLGQNPRLLASGKTSAQAYQNLWSALTSGRTWRGEFINRRKDGSEYIERANVSPIAQADGKITHYLAIKTDITDQTLMQDEISRLGRFDSLTNLPNRRQLQERLRQVLSACSRHQHASALLFIDIDDFRRLNDIYGHSLGDKVLTEISLRLRQDCLRTEDVIARLGGDEFAVIIENLSKDLWVAASQAEEVAEKILVTITKPLVFDSIEQHLTASLGIYLFTGDDLDVEEAIKRADATMYRAKAAGKNCFKFYDPQIQRDIERRITLETDLRRAVSEQQLTIFFQPQFDQDKRLTGAEVLLRWEHSEQGMIPPSEFIPLAEEKGLIISIGLWVLKSACLQLRTWNMKPGWEQFQLSVNISPCQFRDKDFVSDLRELIIETGILPHHLVLEITESTVLEGVSSIIEKMNALKALGVRFSMDDFGTGYSSLSQLKQLPLNELKIDQSFVRELAIDANDEVIVRTIIAMGQNLGLTVIAEGVENASQYDKLLAQGCKHFQGYWFGRPLPAEAFEHMYQSASEYIHNS